jgi:hypothetical protein
MDFIRSFKTAEFYIEKSFLNCALYACMHLPKLAYEKIRKIYRDSL